MKTLNNKGITTVEVVVCFALIVLIASSMYSTVSSFNNKRIAEDYRSQVITYKHLLTKDIQDDFIKIGLTHAKYKKEVSNNGYTTIYTLNAELKDGTSRKLTIERTIAKSTYHPDGATNTGDRYMITYGPEGSELEYPLPELGETPAYTGEYDPRGKPIKSTENTAKDLSISNIYIDIDENNVLSLYIGLYHPELGTRYGINIVCPINYVAAGDHLNNSLDFLQRKLTFNAGSGGTNAPSPQGFFLDEPTKLTLAMPSQIGKLFVGWSKTPGATDPEFFPGREYTFTSEMTLYAVWKDRINLYNRGDECKLYTGGWNYATIEPNGQGEIKDDSLFLTYKVIGNTASEFGTTYDALPGKYKLNVKYKRTAAANTYWGYGYFKFGTKQRISISDNTTGDHFESFNVEVPNGSTISYGNFDSTDYIYEIYLTPAEEEDGRVKIYYELNGGTIDYGPQGITGMEAQTLIKGSTVFINPRVPVYPGHTFKGWSTSPNATSATYTSGSKHAFNNDVTLYAVWS